MKSKLTPLAKLLIVLVVVGGLAFVVYKFKDKLFPAGKGNTETVSDDNVIRIGVNTWGGFAGGQYFNEGFKATEESRFMKEYGFACEFQLLDDFNQCREAWKTDKIDVMYATVDGFTTEVAGLKDLEPQIFFQCDWSRGGDAIVVRRGINGVADLEGKKIAFAEMTASHTFLLWMLEAGNLDYTKITPVKVANGLEAADLFKKGQVDAAVVWSPDDADCVSKVAGSKVLQSTREASNIIADVFVAKKKFIADHQKELKGLVEGFLRGNAEINQSAANKTKAAKILADGMQQPEDFCLQAINNVRLCTYGDNVNFFNIKGTFKGVTGEDIYNQMSLKYSKAGYPTTGIPNWRTVSTPEFISQINLSGAENAAENNATFTAPDETNKTSDAISTKPVSISFATGSAVLDENAKYIIDNEFVDIVKSFANSRIRIEGNTDNTGSAATNKKLSQQRAQAVADYLVKTYNFDANRFVIIGNGPDKPIADNTTPEGKAKNRRTDFQIIPN